MIALFHQNSVMGQQGGVERYLSTLVEHGPTRCLLVLGSDDKTRIEGNVIHVKLRGPPILPRWLRFVAGLIQNQRFVRRAMRKAGVNIIEFSRPELLAIAPLFPAKKVVTMHGTGPDSSDRGKYLIHHAAAALALIMAQRVHIVGRDYSALKPWIRRNVAERTREIDAWCDDVFTASIPPTMPPYKIFYAGRLVGQKNPDLLAQVIQAASARYNGAIRFFYMGSDFAELEQRGCGHIVENLGLKGVKELSSAIAQCHAGILCSGFGEGSPFIIAETLSCGRAFIVPPLPTIRQTYNDTPGVVFAETWSVGAYLVAIEDARNLMDIEGVHEKIGFHMMSRHASRAVPRLLDSIHELVI